MVEGKAIGSPEKLWSRDLIMLTVINFCSSLMFFLLMVVMTGYATEAFGEGAATASLAVSLYIAGGLVGRLFLGPLVDTWGSKRAMLIGFCGNFLISLLYFVPMGWIPFLVVRFSQGMAFALQSGAATTAAMYMIPLARRAEGVGYFSLSQVMGTAIGPFIAASIVQANLGYNVIFCSLSVLAGVTFAAVFFVRVRDAGSGEKTLRFAGLSTVLCASVVPIAVVMGIVFSGYGALLSHLLLYANGKGLGAAASFFFLTYAIATFVGRLFSGRVVDAKGYHVVLLPAISVGALGFFLLAIASDSITLLASAALIGLGLGTTQSTIMAMVAALAPEGQLGKANATYFISLDIGSGVGPMAVGLVYPLIGYELSLGAIGVLFLLALGLYVVEREHGKAL